MKKSLLACLVLAAFLSTGSQTAFARANIIDLYINAVMTADTAALEELLAPNYWNIAGNGHIRDKEHFIQEIRDKTLVVNRVTFTNVLETTLGQTRLVTGTGVFNGKAALPRPEGLMRYTMVIGENNGKEQVVLFQTTPVIPSADCPEGNCKIK